jgi:hypothetical protein
VALALLLLIAVGLLARSFLNVLAVRPGFDPRHVLSARLSLPRVRYDSSEKIATYEARLLAGLVELPGVTSAGAVSLLPLNGQIVQVPFTPADQIIPRERVPYAQYRIVTPGYFAAMAIPVVRWSRPAPASSLACVRRGRNRCEIYGLSSAGFTAPASRRPV